MMYPIGKVYTLYSMMKRKLVIVSLVLFVIHIRSWGGYSFSRLRLRIMKRDLWTRVSDRIVYSVELGDYSWLINLKVWQVPVFEHPDMLSLHGSS